MAKSWAFRGACAAGAALAVILMGAGAAYAQPDDGCRTDQSGDPKIPAGTVECFGLQATGILAQPGGLTPGQKIDTTASGLKQVFVSGLLFPGIKPADGGVGVNWIGGDGFILNFQSDPKYNNAGTWINPLAIATTNATGIAINTGGGYMLNLTDTTVAATGADAIRLEGMSKHVDANFNNAQITGGNNGIVLTGDVDAALTFDSKSKITAEGGSGILISGGAIDATLALSTLTASGVGVDLESHGAPGNTLWADTSGGGGGPIKAKIDGSISGDGGVAAKSYGGDAVCCMVGTFDGGKGGYGGDVQIGFNSALTVKTAGNHDGADGVFVLSQGGAGGDGGNPAQSGSQGGHGGNGGDGGDIAVAGLTANITTTRDGSAGMRLQSLAGKEGAGGVGNGAGNGAAGDHGLSGAIAIEQSKLTISTSGKAAPGISAVTNGGDGTHNTVSLDIARCAGAGPCIQTTGAASRGIEAESIGNRGGMVTVNADTSISTAGDDLQGIYAYNASAHGPNANVYIQTNGGKLDVSTTGANAIGIQGLSKAGAGFAAGDVVMGKGGSNFVASVTTTGDNAEGVRLESLGGSNPNGDGGNGGQAYMYASQWTVSTTGANSAGILRDELRGIGRRKFQNRRRFGRWPQHREMRGRWALHRDEGRQFGRRGCSEPGLQRGERHGRGRYIDRHQGRRFGRRLRHQQRRSRQLRPGQGDSGRYFRDGRRIGWS